MNVSGQSLVRRRRRRVDGGGRCGVVRARMAALSHEVVVSTAVRARFRRRDGKLVLLTPIEVVSAHGVPAIIEPGGTLERIWLWRLAHRDDQEVEVDLEAGRRLLIDRKPPRSPYRDRHTITTSLLVDSARASASIDGRRRRVILSAAIAFVLFVSAHAGVFGPFVVTLARGDRVIGRVVRAEVQTVAGSTRGVLIVEADERDHRGVHYDVEIETSTVELWQRRAGSPISAVVHDFEIVVSDSPQIDFWAFVSTVLLGWFAVYYGALHLHSERPREAFFWAWRSRNPWMEPPESKS